VQDLLAEYAAKNDPDAPAWLQTAAKAEGWPSLGLPENTTPTKGRDTFDVWFESGSSWNAVLRQGWADQQAREVFGNHSGGADLYLEGSDQHRGWFQHSLLPALAITGQPPFKTVLTHGFMVDKDGRKMSKSGGNALKIEDLFKDYGADVCRWWVASLNPDNDIKVDMSFFKLAGEEYRKVRNTLRFLLSNLDDFSASDHSHTFTEADATSLDAWAMGQLAELVAAVRAAFEGYQFRKATEAIFRFCNDTMSSVYLAAVKDRLYCAAADSPRRGRTQTTCYRITSALCELLATVIPHTADEAWRALSAKDANQADGCVHLETLPLVDELAQVPVDPRWADVMQQRHVWLKAMEDFRQANKIDNPLDLGLAAPSVAATLNDNADVPAGDGAPHTTLAANTPSIADLSGFAHEDLADLCGISRFSRGSETLAVQDLSAEPRCDRSWKRDGTVKERSDGGMLCDRDAAAMGLD